jgi:hypothetical protein
MKQVFNRFLFVVQTLLLVTAVLVGGAAVPSVSASPMARPLFASGDFGWAKALTGSGQAPVLGSAIDPSGNIYVTGDFVGTVDFDPGAGTANLTSHGGDDIFVAKYDSAGNYLWAVAIGGSGTDYGTGIAVDASGTSFITGNFHGTADFDPGAGTLNLSATGFNEDVFILGLNTNGGLFFAHTLGDSGFDDGKAITLDGSGNFYTTGFYSGTVDFDFSMATYNLVSPGPLTAAYIAKYDSTANLLWAVSIGGSGSVTPKGIALGPGNQVYTVGYFDGLVDFNPGAGTSNLNSLSSAAYISRLDGNGNYAGERMIAAETSAELSGVAVDNTGTVYAAGDFSGAATIGTFVLPANSGGGGLLVSVAGDLTPLWAEALYGGISSFHNVTVDSVGSLYATGFFNGAVDFDPHLGTDIHTSVNLADAFVMRLTPSGARVWVDTMGGNGVDSGNSLSIDAAGNLVVGGGFEGTADFDPGAGAYNLVSGLGTAGFLAQYTNDGVTDTNPPTLYLPGDFSVPQSTAAGANPVFVYSASDAGGPASPTVTCVPDSGALFAPGTTQVNCSAQDTAGNVANGGFNVTVLSPVVSLSPSSVSFGSQVVGFGTSTQTVTLTNTGAAVLYLDNFSTSGDFALANDLCSARGIAIGASCTFDVTFTPTAGGVRLGTVSIPTLNTSVSPVTLPLDGTGVAPISGNLLNNASFDNFATASRAWRFSMPVPVSSLKDCTVFLSASCSLRLANVRYPGIVTQTVVRNGAAGQSYIFGLSSSALNVPATGQYKVEITFLNRYGRPVFTQSMPFSIGTHGWQNRNSIVTVPAAFRTIRYRIYYYKETAGTAWFDNAYLLQLP